MSKKYRILFYGIGDLIVNKKVIKPVNKYSSVDNIPVFDEEKYPISSGLRKLEASGKVKIVPVPTRVFDNEPQPVVEEPVETIELEEIGGAEPTEGDPEAEEDEGGNERADELVKLLKKKTVPELDALMSTLGLRAGDLKKDEKIDAIVIELTTNRVEYIDEFVSEFVKNK